MLICICQLAFSQNKIDHLFFIIDNKDVSILNKLRSSGLTPATKWETPHAVQGTTGHFFFFLNTYLEILVLTDTAEASKNAQNFGHNINSRIKNGRSKLGIGLRQIPFKRDSIPFTTKVYKQKWMGKEALYMATENTKLQQPLVFLEPPAFANMVVEKLADLDQYAAVNPEMKTYRQHIAGLENLTAIKIFTSNKKKDWGNHLSYFSQFNDVTIKKTRQNFTVLVFDNGKQGKTIDFKNELQLILKY